MEELSLAGREKGYIYVYKLKGWTYLLQRSLRHELSHFSIWICKDNSESCLKKAVRPVRVFLTYSYRGDSQQVATFFPLVQISVS